MDGEGVTEGRGNPPKGKHDKSLTPTAAFLVCNKETLAPDDGTLVLSLMTTAVVPGGCTH